MPPAGDDIETRRSIVEHDLAELRKQLDLASSEATAARVLAAGADRDVSEVRAELRAHTQALNALRETQIDFSRQLADFGRQLADHGRRIDALERKVDALTREFRDQGREMREGFATLATGMAQITALLTNHGESKGSEQSHDPDHPDLLVEIKSAALRDGALGH